MGTPYWLAIIVTHILIYEYKDIEHKYLETGNRGFTVLTCLFHRTFIYPSIYSVRVHISTSMFCLSYFRCRFWVRLVPEYISVQDQPIVWPQGVLNYTQHKAAIDSKWKRKANSTTRSMSFMQGLELFDCCSWTNYFDELLRAPRTTQILSNRIINSSTE